MSDANFELPLPKRLQGVGEYYFSRKLREIAALRTRGVVVINLGIGNPDLPPPPAAVEALVRDATSGSDAHGYQSYRGTQPWRESIRRWYDEVYGVRLGPAEVLPLAGSKEGIAHLCLAYLERGSAVLHPDPGYPAYAAAARLAEADAIGYRLPRFGESSSDWLASMASLPGFAKARVLFVNTPHMPTGAVLSAEHLAALVAFAKTHELLLVSDNAYNYYHPAGPVSLLGVAGAREVLVELNSLSKSHHMPGWRLGALVGRADVLERALQVKSNLDSGQFRGLQAGAAAALTTPPEWHAERNATLAQRRVVGESLLRALGCSVPEAQAGLFVWAELPDGVRDAEAFADRLLTEARVFLPPGTVFGPAGAGHVRLSLCSPIAVLQRARVQLQAAGLLVTDSPVSTLTT